METQVRLNYYSRKLLLTSDLNALFARLFDEVGDTFTVSCAEMSAQEKSEAATEVDDLRVIDDRFHIFVLGDGYYLRRKDIEAEAVRLGQK